MLKDLVLCDDQLSLSINGGAARFDYFWLRDNARDPVSFDSRSHQRELFTALVDPAIRPRRGWVDDSGDSLANLVVTRAFADLERILTAINVDGGALVITGSVGVRYKPMLGAAFRDVLKEPAGDSLSGAFAIGAGLLKS